MFEKSMLKNAYLPKISILLQFGNEILALLYRDDSEPEDIDIAHRMKKGNTRPRPIIV